MQHIQYLIGMSQRFLEGQVIPEDFEIQFENYLFDHEDEIRVEDEKIYTLFAKIRAKGTFIFNQTKPFEHQNPGFWTKIG